jgi:NitT/TauT family transport system substrate-binding protein
MHRLFASGLCFAWLLLAGVVGDVGRAQAQAPKLTDITFSLDFIVLGRHAPFFVAIEKGFFREEGLNVNIISAKGTAHGIQNVESGLAQIGFIDVASLVVARAEGSTVKVASVIYQKAPFCFFSLDPGANVTKLKDFEGLRVGSNTGSYISNIARAMMRKEGLDPSKLSVESIEPSARIAMLATRKIPAIDFFIITKPAMERAVKDAKVVTFLFADHGLDLYSNGIGAKESFLKENPEVMKAFVRASLRGYQYAFKHPVEAAELIQKHAKALNNEITVDELKIVEELSVTPEVKQNGIGSFTTARMQSSVAWMVENGGFPKEKAPKVEDVYATGFLPAKPVMP